MDIYWEKLLSLNGQIKIISLYYKFVNNPIQLQ
jgi:hypothetical protein